MADVSGNVLYRRIVLGCDRRVRRVQIKSDDIALSPASQSERSIFEGLTRSIPFLIAKKSRFAGAYRHCT